MRTSLSSASPLLDSCVSASGCMSRLSIGCQRAAPHRIERASLACLASGPSSQPGTSSQGGRATPPPASSQGKGKPGPRTESATTSGRPPVGTISKLVYKEGEFVELGEVVAAHGVKGELKVDISTDSPKQRFGKKGIKLYLRPPSAKGLLALSQGSSSAPLIELTTMGHKVQMLAEGREIWILSFKEIQDRTIAESLRHYTVVMPSAQREELTDPDEFYAQDLIGCHVFNYADGVYIGKVVELFSGFGTSETLQLNLRPTRQDLDNGRIRSCMVPFVKTMVPLVDKKAKRILVSLPDGLLDLSSTKKIKAMDEARKIAKLQDIAKLQEEEQARRAAQPIIVPESMKQASEPVDLGSDDEEDMDEEEEQEEEQQQRRAPPPRRPRSAAGRRSLRIRPSS